MDFKETVSDITKKVTDKASEVIEMGKLSAKIRTESAEVDDLKKKLGEVCFGKYRAGDVLDPEIEQLCAEIEKHKRNIAEDQRKLRRMKEGDRRTTVDPAAQGFCPYCGAKTGKDAKFCAACGEKIGE